jgi:hypothetical protein
MKSRRDSSLITCSLPHSMLAPLPRIDEKSFAFRLSPFAFPFRTPFPPLVHSYLLRLLLLLSHCLASLSYFQKSHAEPMCSNTVGRYVIEALGLSQQFQSLQSPINHCFPTPDTLSLSKKPRQPWLSMTISPSCSFTGICCMVFGNVMAP